MNAQDPKWDDNCIWPRRLLHIPTMTSYPWRPGNAYGDAVEPRYNAISYTWGRYELRPCDAGYINGRSLAVNGIGWKEFMPRMKPRASDKNSFLPSELERIIRLAMSPCEGYRSVEFIWLDIACIDQTLPRVAEYFSEIGRQARIFRGAQDVFVWLRSYSPREFRRQWDELDGLLEQMWNAQFTFRRDASSMSPVGWISSARGLLDALKSDAWFTSLWTLQEAFLSPNSFVLFQYGLSDDPAHNTRAKDITRLWRLKSISYHWNLLRTGLNHLHLSRGFEGFFSELESLSEEISKIGILDSTKGNNIAYYGLSNDDTALSGYLGNPLTLLTASYERKPSRLEDEVYGIMQVFDLQLGDSSPSHQIGQTYSLEDLRDQLGMELMSKYPITSQFIIQGPGCPDNKAWRVNNNINLSEIGHSFWRNVVQYSAERTETDLNIHRRAALSVEIFNDVRMARFTGLVTRLNDLMEIAGDRLLSTAACFLDLDSRWMADLEIYEMRKKGGLKNVLFSELKTIVSRFNQDVVLLFLGRIEPPAHLGNGTVNNRTGRYLDQSMTLLLLPDENSHKQQYKRIGTMVWSFWHMKFFQMDGPTGAESIEAGWEYLEGIGNGWTVERGFFG